MHRRRCLARSVTLVSRQLGAEQHEDEEGAGEVALPRWRRQRRPLHPEQPQPWAAAPAAAPLGDPRQDSMPPHALTAALRAAPSWQHLHDLCVRHQGALNFIHASAALTTLAKLLAATTPTATDPPLLHPQRRHGPPQHPTPPPSRDLLACIVNTTQLAQAHAPEFQPRALANCLWATAKLLAWMARTYPAPPASHADSPTHAERPAPPAAPAASAPAAPRPRLAPGLTASADASLHSLALRLVDLLPELSPGFEPQHCSSALHALALVHGALLTDGGGAAPAGGREEQPRLDAARVRRAAADLLDVSLPLVPHMGPQVRLGRVPRPPPTLGAHSCASASRWSVGGAAYPGGALRAVLCAGPGQLAARGGAAGAAAGRRVDARRARRAVRAAAAAGRDGPAAANGGGRRRRRRAAARGTAAAAAAAARRSPGRGRGWRVHGAALVLRHVGAGQAAVLPWWVATLVYCAHSTQHTLASTQEEREGRAGCVELYIWWSHLWQADEGVVCRSVRLL